MAIPTQAELLAIDKANGGTASVPLTADQQAIYTIGQSQAVNTGSSGGAVPYVPLVINAADPNGYDSVDSATFKTADISQQPAAASPNDDESNGINTKTVTSLTINQSFNSPIAAQPNVLNQYASYTYSLSWYMLTPNQWNDMKDGKVNMNNWMLIMQSGGAQANVSDGQSGGRSPYFTEDYYMDNLILKTNMPGGGRGSMLGSNLGGSLEFTVTEPNGITLQNNLAQAMQDLLKKNGLQPIDFQKTPHCMVIKFYGYDQEGNLVQAGVNGAQTSIANSSTSRAVITKVYPFYITKFSYRLASRVVEYKVNANAIPYRINASSQRGTIPEKFELVGKTVGDILAGNGATPTQVFVPDGRVESAAPPASKNPQPTTRGGTIADKSATGLVSPDGMDFTAGNF